MYHFIAQLIQLGASIPGDDLQTIVDVIPLVDQFTDRSLAEEIHHAADTKFETVIGVLGSMKFVNPIVDAGTVQGIKAIPCLLTNTFYTGPPLLFDLRTNTNFTKNDYIAISVILVIKLKPLESSHVHLPLIIYRRNHLDSMSSPALNNPAIFHVKCFAHMANLVLATAMKSHHLECVFVILNEIQDTLRTEDTKTMIRVRCAKLVRTRWFYMVDTLAFILKKIDAVTVYLTVVHPDEPDLARVPLEVFELHIRLFYQHNCSLSWIVPLARGLLSALSDARKMLKSPTASHEQPR
jgi:hypothetical protein